MEELGLPRVAGSSLEDCNLAARARGPIVGLHGTLCGAPAEEGRQANPDAVHFSAVFCVCACSVGKRFETKARTLPISSPPGEALALAMPLESPLMKPF